MPGPYKKKRRGKTDSCCKLVIKGKRRTKDIDEIQKELRDLIGKVNPHKSGTFDVDKPGGCVFTCVECARDFIDEASLSSHLKSKNHKQRLKLLKEDAYTIEESRKAAGHGSYT